MSLQLSGTKHISDINIMIDDIGEELVDHMKDELHVEDKLYTGAAIDSIQYNKFDQVVYSDLIYVYNIEFGRQKGNPPPLDKIHGWVEKKLDIHPPESVDVARAIQASIAKNGIKPTRFTKKAILWLIGKPFTKGKRVKRAKKTKWQRFLANIKKKSKIVKRYTKKSIRTGKKAYKKTNKGRKFISRISKSKGRFGRL